MRTYRTIRHLKAYLGGKISAGKSIGFVPTMGALHRGHLSLVKQAMRENDLVVVSIFVNPIQFNNPEDLQKYPRDENHDLQLLKNIGCDVVFLPSVKEIYPDEVSKQYDFGLMDKVMEGEFRPGHFNGVAVVVNRLFSITTPCRAYFGKKDFQQLAIVKEMVAQENLPVEIIPCDIIREDDGLAMSSRNQRLTKEHREASPLIYQALKKAKELRNEYPPEIVKNKIIEIFPKHRILKLEYFDVVDAKTLQSIKNWSDAPHVQACIAVYAGKVRLIDNVPIF